ncbi:MAG TPA: tRNA (adenosine(37)-N6)-dimethylallyltransferase MiaA [Methylophilaceae bacterium]|nr:tRNA (adenosine(37)-N6)-dimethylallyltransferase MiaA [Methylophilaceae bacterium]
MNALHKPAIFLMGPTASGKTGLAVELAQRYPVELISVDSALVYRDMDIGTAKPDAETLARAPHALIDIIDPTEAYSAAQFYSEALELMAEITARGKIPLLVGGTMLYFKALQGGLSDLPQANVDVRKNIENEAKKIGWQGLHIKLSKIDAETAARLEPTDAQRIQRALEVYEITGQPMSSLFKQNISEELPYRLLKIALLPSERAVLHERIAQRFDIMLEQGLLDELTGLRQQYPQLSPDMPSMRCVGYRQAWQYMDGEYGLPHLREKGIAATRQLAKRQMTWLRGMDDLTILDCLEAKLLDSTSSTVGQFINCC